MSGTSDISPTFLLKGQLDSVLLLPPLLRRLPTAWLLQKLHVSLGLTRLSLHMPLSSRLCMGGGEELRRGGVGGRGGGEDGEAVQLV